MSDRQHSVYIALDINGDCLYVGRTSVGERRMRQHGKASQWWPRVARVEVTHYSTVEEAAIREFEAIKRWRPEFNIEVPTRLKAPAHWGDVECFAFRSRWSLVELWQE